MTSRGLPPTPNSLIPNPYSPASYRHFYTYLCTYDKKMICKIYIMDIYDDHIYIYVCLYVCNGFETLRNYSITHTPPIHISFNCYCAQQKLSLYLFCLPWFLIFFFFTCNVLGILSVLFHKIITPHTPHTHTFFFNCLPQLLLISWKLNKYLHGRGTVRLQ